MIIAKEFTFDAAHTLPNEECYGKCRNLHGHTYKLIVEIQGDVNDKGWVMNFKDLKAIVNEFVIDKLDHANINDFVKISTAENILIWMRDQIKPRIWKRDNVVLWQLILWETPTSYARLLC